MKKLLACVMALALCMSIGTQAFALGTNVNSVGSVAGDVADDLAENDFGSEVTGKDTTQQKESEYQELEVADDAVTATVDVYATQATGEDIVDDEGNTVDGTVMVVVPKVVILDGATGEGAYVVKVKGNIAGDEIITVAPDATVTLEQEGKDDITATITQAKQRFAYNGTTAIAEADDLAKTVTTDYATTTVDGSIATDDLTAGSWHGTFAFNISFAA